VDYQNSIFETLDFFYRNVSTAIYIYNVYLQLLYINTKF